MQAQTNGADDGTEAYRELCSMANKKTASIPVELVVDKVLKSTVGADWPVQREAMRAVLRRFASAKSEELEIAAFPKAEIFGFYSTKRKNEAVRPYRTLLYSLQPLLGSCDCPDYLKNSLGLCKHVIAVSKEIFDKPLLLKRAGNKKLLIDDFLLSWDPVKPLLGKDSQLSRLRLEFFNHRRAKLVDEFCQRYLVESKQSGVYRPKAEILSSLKSQEEFCQVLQKIVSRQSRKAAPVDPALPQIVEQQTQKIKNANSQLTSSEVKKLLKSMKIKLYPYQVDAVIRFVQQERLLLADDMGLGKTAQAVASCEVLWKSGKVKRGLLIVPASLKFQWKREWENFVDLPVAIVDGSPEDRRALYKKTKQGFLIANYEQLFSDLSVVRAWNPDLVVLDEAQKIKNWQTKTAHYVKSLTSRYRLVLTGTPMENRIDELASIMDWVDEDALAPKWRLAPWHNQYVDGDRAIGGVRNLSTLRERLEPSMLRRLRNDVIGQLPERTDTVIPVEFTQEQAEEHEAFSQPISKLMQIGKKRPLTQVEFLRLMSMLNTQRMIANGLAQYRFVDVWPEFKVSHRDREDFIKSQHSPKLLAFRELIRELVFVQKRKVLIFSQWRRMLTLAHWAVEDLLSAENLRAGFFTGKESQKRRMHNIIEFHDKDDLPLLFLSDAGGTGLNLQHAANALINLELPWNPAVLEQRIARIHRNGQQNAVNIYNLICSESIEGRIHSKVQNKQAFFTGLFDGQQDSVNFDSSASFLDTLEKIVSPVSLPEQELISLDNDETEEEDILVTGEDLIDRAEESGDEDTRSSDFEPGSFLAIQELFSKVSISKTSSGKLLVEAEPEAAATLSALFKSMANLMDSAVR